ncbi:MAG: hypothetical protein J5601_05590 [Elusimicrobiaceae bacterium]|nr:hypothetical protein [Elusimicrobiaceae bacterium]
MKKLLLFLQFVFFACTSLYAVPNAPYEEFDLATGTSHFKRSSFLTQAMKGSVRIKMEYSLPLDGPTREMYKELVVKAINAWFATAAKMIKDNDRKEEFADVYPMFAKGIKVSFDNSAPDATVRVCKSKEEMQKICGENAGACYDLSLKIVTIPPLENVYGEELVLNYLIHEFGHALALGDQYDSAYYKNQWISRRYGSLDSNVDSMMGEGWLLNEDDIDGLINVIDLERLAQGKPSPREPWLAFTGRCIYHNGEDIERTDKPLQENYYTETEWEFNGKPTWSISFHANPQLQLSTKGFSLEEAPSYENIDILKVIREPLRLKSENLWLGPNGEKVRCYDILNKTMCFGGSFKGNDLIHPESVFWVQSFRTEFFSDGDQWITRTLEYMTQGTLIKLSWSYSLYRSLEGHVEIINGDFKIHEEKLEESNPFDATVLRYQDDEMEAPRFDFYINSENEQSMLLSQKREQNLQHANSPLQKAVHAKVDEEVMSKKRTRARAIRFANMSSADTIRPFLRKK